MSGTVLIEAFGSLSPEGGSIDDLEEDLYSVFRARSELQGCSTLGRGHPGLWGTEEAAIVADASGRIGWVQVGLEDGASLATALPPLTQCFADCLDRFGMTALAGLQVSAFNLPPSPSPSPAPSQLSDMVSALNWFTLKPGLEVGAHVALSAHLQDGADLLPLLGRWNTGPFRFDQGVVQEPLVAPAEAGHPLPGKALGLAVLLPEWSASALGWTLAATTVAALMLGSGEAITVRCSRTQP